MKTLDIQLRSNSSFNSFLFKDEYYNYFLQGRELVLFPLGKRKERRYQLTNNELSQLVDYYVLPLQKLRNEHLYIEGFMNKVLDVEDNMMAFLDSIIK